MGGFQWRTESEFLTLISGEVLIGGIWQPTIWNVLGNGNLYCSSNREKNIDLEVQPVAPRIVNYPQRFLDTDFVINNFQDAQANYTVELVTNVSFLGLSSDQIDIDLKINNVVISTSRVLVSTTLSIGLAFTHTRRQVLSGYVPKGSTVNLATSRHWRGNFVIFSRNSTIDLTCSFLPAIIKIL